MPRFHFHLRAVGTINRDLEGTELPDLSAARSYAAAVTEELMRNSGAGTRHWSMCVENDGGEAQFDLFFADVDPSLAAYSPQMRRLVSDTCRRLGALTDVLCAAYATGVETRMLLARARGKPQLVYSRRE
jgi:Domain of unknown function (DUF6894)